MEITGDVLWTWFLEKGKIALQFIDPYLKDDSLALKDCLENVHFNILVAIKMVRYVDF